MRYYSGELSDHFDGERFFNPDQQDSDRSFGDVLRWKFKEKPAAWPASVAVEAVVPQPRVEGLRITIAGHASVLIQAAGLNILTDPVWSERASPFRFAGPQRVAPPGIAFDDLPPIDVVLVSHNHYDHLDVATLKRLHDAHNPLIITPLGNDAIIKQAVPGARVAVGDWWDGLPIGDGAEAILVPAYHWSARGLRDRRCALWSGFWVRTPAGTVYFAGDTGYNDGAIFREMRLRLGSPDVALLPIGAYAPRWFMRAQHIDPDEAVRIMTDLEARRAIAIHWGVFQLTDEPREEPRDRLHAALARAGIDAARFPAAEPGAVVDIIPAG